MPDLEQTPSPDQRRPGTDGHWNTPAGAIATDADGADPFAHLHTMSTTAGVGTQEYVAVNSPSVAAILLGLASGLALLNPILLVIPIIGVVTAIVALRQIRDSNGTQTGRLLAWGGLLVSVVFVALAGGEQVRQGMEVRENRGALAASIKKLEGHLIAEQYDQAHAMFGVRFIERVTPADFKLRWDQLQNMPAYGKLKAIEWNERAQFDTDPQTGDRYARGLIDLRMEKLPQPFRQEIIFRRSGAQWQVEDIPGLFQAPRQDQPGM
ncbi:MAG: DUF4190 domain-containing protein [Tepidisphaeraceae bacterium]